MENNVIVLKQLPVIEEHLKQVKDSVDQRVSEAVSLVCTEETRKDVKAVRAALGKEFDAFEEQRKEIKRAILAPYESFETEYKRCIADSYKHAKVELDKKVNAVEDEIKDGKQAEVEAFYDELSMALDIPAGIAPFERSGIRVNLSASVTSMKKQADTFLRRIAGEIDFIRQQEFADEVMVEYRKTLNAIQAVESVNNRHAAMEAERERMKAQQEARKQTIAAQEQVELAIAEQEPTYQEEMTVPTEELLPEDEFAEPVQPEPITQPDDMRKLTFVAVAPMSKLRKLTAYMKEEGIYYEIK